MKSLSCPNCGAALPARSLKDDLAACEFCGTSFRVPKTLTPEADMGDLILGVDFSKPVNPGWMTVNDDKLTFHKGSPDEMRATFAAQTNSYYTLKSSGFLDDFDVSVSIRFFDGLHDYIHAGVFLRHSEEGGYGVKISAQASYTFGYVARNEKGELSFNKIMPWSYHLALHKGTDQYNRLRVICNGNSFRIYLNGVFATSFQDDRFKMGRIYLCADATEKSSIRVGYSDLQVREVLQ
jgi:hypothetical protein